MRCHRGVFRSASRKIAYPRDAPEGRDPQLHRSFYDPAPTRNPIRRIGYIDKKRAESILFTLCRHAYIPHTFVFRTTEYLQGSILMKQYRRLDSVKTVIVDFYFFQVRQILLTSTMRHPNRPPKTSHRKVERLIYALV